MTSMYCLLLMGMCVLCECVLCVHACMCVITILWFSRLQNLDEGLVISSCEFICEVLLQDFPPEMFLQRPVITKVTHAYSLLHWACKYQPCEHI